MFSRRSFFTGAAAIITAPAIVRVASIMPVKVVVDRRHRWMIAYVPGEDRIVLRADVLIDELGNMSAPPMPSRGVIRFTERQQRRLDAQLGDTGLRALYRRVDWHKDTRCRAQYHMTCPIPADLADELSTGGFQEV